MAARTCPAAVKNNPTSTDSRFFRIIPPEELEFPMMHFCDIIRERCLIGSDYLLDPLEPSLLSLSLVCGGAGQGGPRGEKATGF